MERFPFHGNLARALVILGKPKDALAEADRAIDTSNAGNRLACRLLRVEIYALARDYTTAEADCLKLLQETSAPSEERQAGWDRFLTAPAPVGYDPSIIPPWTSPEADAFGVLRLEPTRLRVRPGSVMLRGTGEVLTWSG